MTARKADDLYVFLTPHGQVIAACLTRDLNLAGDLRVKVLNDFAVIKSHQGRGIGRMFAETLVRSLGHTWHLVTAQPVPGIEPFWRSVGFAPLQPGIIPAGLNVQLHANLPVCAQRLVGECPTKPLAPNARKTHWNASRTTIPRSAVMWDWTLCYERRCIRGDCCVLHTS